MVITLNSNKIRNRLSFAISQYILYSVVEVCDRTTCEHCFIVEVYKFYCGHYTELLGRNKQSAFFSLLFNSSFNRCGLYAVIILNSLNEISNGFFKPILNVLIAQLLSFTNYKLHYTEKLNVFTIS